MREASELLKGHHICIFQGHRLMNCQMISADTSELTKQKLEILLRYFFNENMTQLDILRQFFKQKNNTFYL